ncbi:MAG: GIY-YIG nuclease family protein [Clostridia bacterium]|nr:GIY-YIG nuclease family protein [Clostridia bacterium]
MIIYYVCILTTKNNKMLYIGVTNDLQRRLYEHKNKMLDGFSKKYNINKLVYYEEFHDIEEAIAREKQLKGWKRFKKNALIEIDNPSWEELSF